MEHCLLPRAGYFYPKWGWGWGWGRGRGRGRATRLMAPTDCVRLGRSSEKSPGSQVSPALSLPSTAPQRGVRSGTMPAFSVPRVLEVKQLSWAVPRLLHELFDRTQTQICGLIVFLESLLDRAGLAMGL